LEALLGLNLAAIGCQFAKGPRAILRASRIACLAVKPSLPESSGEVFQELDKIPVRNLGDILGEAKCEIKIRTMKYEDGMMPYRDALGLLSILVLEKPSEVLEIGTFMGHTTRAMAENLESARIHTIDLPLGYPIQEDTQGHLPKDDFHLISRRVVGREFKNSIFESRIRQHFGDSATMDFSEMGQPSFFFIDGSHTYEYCKSDSEKCLALCPKGGTFLWHDCNGTHPGVVKFINEWRSLGRDVIRIADTDLGYWKSL
jgi:hypothetical protein